MGQRAVAGCPRTRVAATSGAYGILPALARSANRGHAANPLLIWGWAFRSSRYVVGDFVPAELG